MKGAVALGESLEYNRRMNSAAIIAMLGWGVNKKETAIKERPGPCLQMVNSIAVFRKYC